jgi:hypothetical protein
MSIGPGTSAIVRYTGSPSIEVSFGLTGLTS